MSPSASVIVPAHNEERTLRRCLNALLAGAQPGEFDIVVVANGCSDATATVAREFMPEVTVIELEEASKRGALNAGDRVTDVFPRIYLDGDVVLTTDAARDVVRALSCMAPCLVAPAPDIVLDDRHRFIRAFYRCWMRSSFLGHNVIGNGVYAMNQQGRARFGEFPALTADDLFVYVLFEESERITLASSSFVITPPKTLPDLVRVRTRVYYGNAELALSNTAPTKRAAQSDGRPDHSANSVLVLFRQIRSARDAADLAVYVSINSVAKFRANRRLRRGLAICWDRDHSTRS